MEFPKICGKPEKVNREKSFGIKRHVDDLSISFHPRKERIMQTSQRQWMNNHCIFYEEAALKVTDFKVANINKRERIVASKKLCFTEALKVKAMEYPETVMSNITALHAPSHSNRNYRLLKAIKSNR